MITTSTYIEERQASRRLKVPNHPSPPEIDHNIPIPTEARGGTRKYDHFYPFEQMQPGDSFWVPSTTQCTSGAITKFSKKSGWKFTSRAQTKDGCSNKQVSRGKRGTRVWRVSAFLLPSFFISQACQAQDKADPSFIYSHPFLSGIFFGLLFLALLLSGVIGLLLLHSLYHLLSRWRGLFPLLLLMSWPAQAQTSQPIGDIIAQPVCGEEYKMAALLHLPTRPTEAECETIACVIIQRAEQRIWTKEIRNIAQKQSDLCLVKAFEGLADYYDTRITQKYDGDAARIKAKEIEKEIK